MVRRFPDDWCTLFLSPANLKAGENSFRERTDRRSPGVRYASLLLPKPDSGSAILRAATKPLTLVGGREVLRRAASFGPDVAVTSYIYAAPLIRRLQEKGVPVVYDCNDLHTEFYPSRREEARAMFRRTVADVDEVVASSRALSTACGRGVVIGNGVDLDTFTGRRDAPLPEAIADGPLARLSRFVIYVGSVDERVDFDIVERTAALLSSERPDVGMVFVGRIFAPVTGRCRKIEERHRGRVLFAGRAPYEELPRWMSNADVGIAPFVLNERTSAINPNKLYMYAAMDMNVVTTPFSRDVTDQGDAVFCADGPDAFAGAVLDALNDSAKRASIRRRVALPNSWDERAREFTQLLGLVASRR